MEEAVHMKIDRRQPLTMKDVEARRALVRKHMCDLMKSVTRNKEFNDPDEWIDTILDWRRQANYPSES